ILAYTMPAWAIPLSVLLLGERLTAQKLLGLALGMAGMLLLVWDEFHRIQGAPRGALLVLGAAFSSAIGTAYNVLLAFAWAHWAAIKLATSVSVTVFSLCTLVIPVVGVFSGMLFLGERPGWPEYTALAFVLGSLATVVLPQKKPAGT